MGKPTNRMTRSDIVFLAMFAAWLCALLFAWASAHAGTKEDLQDLQQRTLVQPIWLLQPDGVYFCFQINMDPEAACAPMPEKIRHNFLERECPAPAPAVYRF